MIDFIVVNIGSKQMKKGLVMEGGAMRGMFTCGVIDVLMENNIDFDSAVGVSAGATFGLNIKSKQIGRGIRYNKKYCNDKRYASLSSLIKTGDIYNVPFCYGTLPYELDKWDYDTFYKNPMDFYCVATELSTGNAVYHKCDNYDATPDGIDIKWIRASASMPVVSKPVPIADDLYLDGGMSDSIPLRFMEKQNCDRILVIETQPADFVKKPQIPIFFFIFTAYLTAVTEIMRFIYNNKVIVAQIEPVQVKTV